MSASHKHGVDGRSSCEQKTDKTVSGLWFERERENAEDIELRIGIFENEVDAQAAIGRLKGQAGLR